MLQQDQGGRIINISSARQEQAWPGNAHYCASKGGIYMLTRVMALELGPRGITVNCLSPGTILTDMNRNKFSDSGFRQQRIERIPLGRLGAPEDVVSAAVLLASDNSAFINGASLMIDGGQTIW
jgi:NAD(P)-dependent dehydrogenase (short-subunit alcohol dehydrogenase family)